MDLERVARPAASVRSIVMAVMLLVSLTATGTLALYGVFRAPTTLDALVPRVDRVERALQDTVKNRLSAVEAGLAAVDSTLEARLQIMRSIDASLDTLRGSTFGIECVVLLELSPRVCLARQGRRAP